MSIVLKEKSMLQTKRDVSIKPKGVYYDLVNKKVVQAKDKAIHYFPSHGEFECFKILNRLENFELRLQPVLTVPPIKWKLDFQVKGVRTNRLISLLTGEDLLSLNSIFIEYKGYADRNFRFKLRQTYINSKFFYNCILLVGQEDTTYNFVVDGKWISKRVVSLSSLEYAIERLNLLGE